MNDDRREMQEELFDTARSGAALPGEEAADLSTERESGGAENAAEDVRRTDAGSPAATHFGAMPKEVPELAAASSGEREAPRFECPSGAAPDAPEPAAEVSDAEFGAQVRELRIRSGLSVEEVSAETLIKADYLRALEAGDFDALPALVYVTAYLRRLCRLYGAAPDVSDALVLQLHDHLSYEIPEHPAAKVHDIETDEREQRRIRQIVFGVAATAVLLVLILAVAAVLLFAGTGGDREPFDKELLLRLQPRPELTISVLPAREPGR